VQRGLAYEGLGDWEQSVKDYSQAIQLWGGGRGPEINPFCLSFRGNSLARLGRYEGASAGCCVLWDVGWRAGWRSGSI
jgi:tetratricopeptide (TPR) repeat protein